MIQELVNTSVPAGLYPGTEGFCTVACTQSMAPNIRTQLELMGGYRAVWKLGDPKVSENPVLMSHYRLLIGGCFYNVLSRIATCGADHQGRLNRIAHHIILENYDQSPKGPAAILQNEKIIFKNWDGPPKHLPMGRIHFSGKTMKPAICNTWQKLAGDAGWAGEIVQAAINDPTKASYIIYRPGMDVTALLNEAFALVPVSRKWDITFSTHFDILPPKADACTWRFCVEGSKTAAQAAQNATSGIVVDLTSPPKSAGDHYYTRMARTGDDDQQQEELTYSPPPVTKAQTSPVRSSKKQHRFNASSPQINTHQPGRKHKQNSSPAKFILGLAAIAIIILQAVVIIDLMNNRGKKQPTETLQPTKAPATNNKDQSQLKQLKRINAELRKDFDQKIKIAKNIQETQTDQLQMLLKENEKLKKQLAAKQNKSIKPKGPSLPQIYEPKIDNKTREVIKTPVEYPKVKRPADGYVKLNRFVPDNQFASSTIESTIYLPDSRKYDKFTLSLPCKLPQNLKQTGNNIFLEGNENFKKTSTIVVSLSASKADEFIRFSKVKYGQDNKNLATFKKLEEIMQYATVKTNSDKYQFIKPLHHNMLLGRSCQILLIPNDIVTIKFISQDIKIKAAANNRWEVYNPNGVNFVATYIDKTSNNKGLFSIELAKNSTPESLASQLRSKTDDEKKLQIQLAEKLKLLDIPQNRMAYPANLRIIAAQLVKAQETTKNKEKLTEIAAAKNTMNKLMSTGNTVRKLKLQQKWLSKDRSFDIELQAADSEATLCKITVNYKK